MVYLRTGVHGGEDVAVYAKGPWAHLFTGSHENTYIPIALAYAACLNQKGPHCKVKNSLSRSAPELKVEKGFVMKFPSSHHTSPKGLASLSPPCPPSPVKALERSGFLFRNQTLIDHINGHTIAPDVMKPSRRVVRKVLRRSNPFDAGPGH